MIQWVDAVHAGVYTTVYLDVHTITNTNIIPSTAVYTSIYVCTYTHAMTNNVENANKRHTHIFIDTNHINVIVYVGASISTYNSFNWTSVDLSI